VPAQRDGFVGFHDEISGEFICNKTGFTFGGVDALPEIVDPYIESDGTAGINTGVQAQPGLKIEVDYQITKPLGEMVPQWRIVATDADDKNPRASAYVNASTNIALTSGDSWASATSTGIKADTLRHKVILGDTGNKCYYTLGNTPLATISGNAITKRSLVQIALLATSSANYGASFSNKIKARLYGAKFWVGDKLIRDFRPRTLNGVAGLEDVAQGGFYTSSGYTASAGVTEGLTATPAYIENDGSFFSYVNTRYYVNPKTKVEVDYQMVKLQASKIIFGSYGDSVGTTALMWHDGSGWAYPQARDGKYVAPAMSPKVYMDSGRHTALLDIPAGRLAVMDVNGVVETEGTCSDITKTAAWPSLLFSASKDKYGHAYDGQMATCRIYGARIWEKEGEEYVLKHNFTPVEMTGIAGFKDTVTGKFFSGDKLTAAGASVPTMDDCDPYLDTTTAGGRYFDTGVYVTSNTCVVCDFMPTLQQKTQQFPFEAGDSVSATNANQKTFYRAYGNGSAGTGDWSWYAGRSGFTSTSVPYQPNVRRCITIDGYNLKVKLETNGGTDYDYTLPAWTRNPNKSSTTLKLLCNQNMNANSCRGRLYGFKIYESGELVRDYVPVAQGGTGALLDKVQGKILNKASNSNAFVVSDDLTVNDDWLTSEQRAGDAYIESDGTQVINTGYCATPQTRFEVDYQFTAIRGQNRVFGSVTSTSIAEMYLQGENTGSGNVAFLVGDTQTTQVTGKGSDLDRHRGVLDLYSHTVGYTGWGYKAAPTAFSMTNGTAQVALFTKNTSNTGFSGWADKNVSKMKLYAFRIYEAGELRHQYLPYKNGDTIGLYDTETGNILTKLAAGSAAANEFTYGGEGYGGYRGAAAPLVVYPADADVGLEGRTLTAYAPGAVKYVWTKNGEVVQGASGATLDVAWTRGVAFRTAVYGVAPVFSVDGKEVVGEVKSATLTMEKPGMAILVK